MKLLIALLTLGTALAAHAANPAFQDFNTNQFGTTGNKVFFKSSGNGAVVTNFNVADGTLLVSSPGEFQLTAGGLEGEGRFLVSDLNGVAGWRTNWLLTSITNGLLSGDLSLNGRTNRLSISAGGQLLLDGSPITGGGDTLWELDTNTIPGFPILKPTTIPATLEVIADQASGDLDNIQLKVEAWPNFASGNGTNIGAVQFGANSTIGSPAAFQTISAMSADGMTLAIWDHAVAPSGSSLDFSVGSTNYLNIPPSPGVTTDFTLSLQGQTNQIGDNGTALTFTGSPIADTTATNIVTLTQTGTNVSAMNYALVQRGGAFKLQLTGTGYIGAPSGVASTPFSKAWLIVQQPSTGGCFLTFTNGFYQFPEGVAPIIDTNNGAVTIFQFVSDPITNGLLHGWMSLKSKLIP